MAPALLFQDFHPPDPSTYLFFFVFKIKTLSRKPDEYPLVINALARDKSAPRIVQQEAFPPPLASPGLSAAVEWPISGGMFECVLDQRLGNLQSTAEEYLLSNN